MLENISITGITPLEYYPNTCYIKYCKQNIQRISICVPYKKPEMESINEIKANLCINSYKLLNTILGPKILINISSNIKVIYTANNEEQSLHSAHWDIEFCDFILLENMNCDECDICLSNFFIGLEDVCVNSYNERYLDLSLLYVICTNFNNSTNSPKYSCKYFKDHYQQEFNMDCKQNPDSICNNDTNNYNRPIEYYDNALFKNYKNACKK